MSKRWTKAELDAMSNREFLLAFLEEAQKERTWGSPVGKKLGEVIEELTKDEISNGGFVAYKSYENDSEYAGISIDYKAADGNVIPIATAENTPEGTLQVRIYEDAYCDEPTHIGTINMTDPADVVVHIPDDATAIQVTYPECGAWDTRLEKAIPGGKPIEYRKVNPACPLAKYGDWYNAADGTSILTEDIEKLACKIVVLKSEENK